MFQSTWKISSNAVLNYSVSAHYIATKNKHVVNNNELSHRPNGNENNTNMIRKWKSSAIFLGQYKWEASASN